MKYDLYDLEITLRGDPKKFNCSHKLSDVLLVRGENLSFKRGTTQFSHYALNTLMPYIAAKQRATAKNDWMSFESDIACPDPNCGATFHIARVKRRQYDYSPID